MKCQFLKNGPCQCSTVAISKDSYRIKMEFQIAVGVVLGHKTTTYKNNDLLTIFFKCLLLLFVNQFPLNHLSCLVPVGGKQFCDIK